MEAYEKGLNCYGGATEVLFRQTSC
jgi:hypothetical protein